MILEVGSFSDSHINHIPSSTRPRDVLCGGFVGGHQSSLEYRAERLPIPTDRLGSAEETADCRSIDRLADWERRKRRLTVRATGMVVDRSAVWDAEETADCFGRRDGRRSIGDCRRRRDG